MIEIAILALYFRLAACVGVGNPLPVPIIVFKDKPSVECSQYDRCKGVYYPRARRIITSLQQPGTIGHEMLHDLLEQAGRPDPLHKGPEWVTCHDLM